MPEGQIVRAVGGFFDVRTPEGDIRCRARGILKKKNLSPLVGDYVIFERTGPEEGVVTEVRRRRTQLVRPPIANVEQAVVLFSLREPPLQPVLLDRILVHCERAGLRVCICLTKLDLAPDRTEVDRIAKLYAPAGYRVVATSIRTGEGVEQVKEWLKGTLSVFAGPSGVGKSSLLNEILPGLKLRTGQVSAKLGRGRHTTRHVEIIDLPDGGRVADSPGFSRLDFTGMEEADLGDCFPEIREHAVHCAFRGCLHREEPNCAVREAADRGEIDPGRYRHYLQFLQEISEDRRFTRW
ncbi:MAG: ribosome small subunit-dependent GTPase A [Planifilum fimeticola]|jgi:ribosome biogenesis GTPase